MAFLYSGNLNNCGIAASIVPARRPSGNIFGGIRRKRSLSSCHQIFNDVLTGLSSIVLGVVRLSSLFW
jgi:hypothetical protein